MEKNKNSDKKFLSFLISLLPKVKGNGEVNDLLLNLPRFYLNEDLEIAIESIRSSGIKGNIFALEKLFKAIEEGLPEVQIEAIRAIDSINPPLIHERLIEYYNLLSNKNVKIEILKLLNSRYYKNKEVINLNRSIVSDNSIELDFKIVSISGLVRSKDFSFLSFLVPHGESRLVEEILVNIIEQDGIDVEEFLKRQADHIDYFSDITLGYYLSAYNLKVGGAKASILNRILNEKNTDIINAYLDLCEKGVYFTDFSKRLFRILLSFPILDFSDNNLIEKRGRRLLKIIIDLANRGSVNDVRELIRTANVQLTSLYKNLVLSHISLSGIKYRGEFYYRLFAQLFEKFLPEELLADVIDYFSGKNIENASLLVSTIMQFAKTSGDKRLVEACVPLFYESDERKRLQIYSILKKVNPNVKVIAGRIGRTIYSLAGLNARSLSKKIEEIYRYSIDEKIREVEAESIVALSVVKRNVVEDRIKSILRNLEGHDFILAESALESIASLNPDDMEKIVDDNFILQLENRKLIESFLKKISQLNYALPNKTQLVIVRNIEAFKRQGLLNQVVEIISEKGNWAIYSSIKSFIQSKANDIKVSYIEILRRFKRRNIAGIKSELITNFLYSLLKEEKIERKSELYSSVISFLMELNDDYSFKIFESIVDRNEFKLAIKILKKLPHHIVKKEFFTIVGLIEGIDTEGLRELKGYFCSLPEEFFDDSIKNYILKGIKEWYSKGKAFMVSEDIGAEKDAISLVEKPKEEFRIQYEQTKEITVFFIDIANYTKLSSKLDLTGLMKVVNNFEKIVISTVEDFKGRVVKKMGDGILAVFHHPLNAVIAGLIVQDRIRDFNDFVPIIEKFKARIGIHTGSVVFRNNDIFGDNVNIASRIESMAEPGKVLVSENVYNLTKNFIKYSNTGPLKLKGVSEPVNSYAPESLTEDLIKYLEIKNSNKTAVFNGEIRGDIARKLKVIMFDPDFAIPDDVKKKYDLRDLKEIFESFNKYIESFVKDYLEEYEVKSWLQNKWNEILNRQKNID